MLRIIKDDEFVDVFEGDKPIVLTFFADWCGPCKLQHPVLEKMASKPEFKDVEFVKINIEDSSIAAAFNILSIPQTVLLRDTEEVKRLVGYKSDKELTKEVKEAFNL